MLPRSLLQVLVFGWALLIVAFAVVMGAYALAQGMGDALGAAILRGVAIGLVLLLAIDGVLLTAALGLESLTRREREGRRSAPPRREAELPPDDETLA